VNLTLQTLDAMCRDQPNSWEKMCDFMVEFLKYAKIHGRSLRNSRAPQLLFRGNLLNSTFEISEQRIFMIVINVLSQDSRLNVSK